MLNDNDRAEITAGIQEIRESMAASDARFEAATEEFREALREYRSEIEPQAEASDDQ
ncbi:MAG: hypothetical protein KME15_26410 [Drouetiella hepatica Uher 2000/2452]|jgi:hypothetical protein|uniref:Uncharacterized protein n=1 Tax=Drouetiella hepatica Uher 2000/2452 TaxID=904376 RepID=A0A951QGZ1_9CYAN|nr:hypothetical protein [Drouetiella hepatica Uher 2000/2452]